MISEEKSWHSIEEDLVFSVNNDGFGNEWVVIDQQNPIESFISPDDESNSIKRAFIELIYISLDPWRILEDAGMAFSMGTIGGGTWHFVKGYRNSPIGDRFRGAFKAMQFRAPVLGGNFAVWGGVFSTFDCAFISLRQKEDAWNAIISGALTGGVLAARGGPSMAFKSAIIGGVFLALIEGVALGFSRLMSEQYRPPTATSSTML